MPPKPRKEAACLVLLMSKELAKEVVEAYYDLDDAFHHLPGEDEGDTFGVTAGLASMDPREAGSVASFQAHARDVARDSRGFPPHASLVEQTKAHMARKHQGWDAGGIGINPNMRAYLSSHGNLLANVPQDQVTDPSIAERPAFDQALIAKSGFQAILQSVKSAKDLPSCLEEACFRLGRVQELLGEVDALSARHLTRRRVTADGDAEVVLSIVNVANNSRVNLSVAVPWHYPSGRLQHSHEVLFGDVAEEAVEDAFSAASTGSRRLARIAAELSGGA